MVEEDTPTPPATKLANIGTQKSSKVGETSTSMITKPVVPPKSKSPKLKCVSKAVLTKKMAPKDQIVGRRYSTRRLTKLISRLDDSLLIPKETTVRNSSSRDSDGSIEADSPEERTSTIGVPSGEPEGNSGPSEKQVMSPAATHTSQTHSGSPHVDATPLLDLSSRRARLSHIGEQEIQVDLSFSDVAPSAVSDFAFGKSGPSTEALMHAKSAVQNFLNLGLHHLAESHRLAMLSSVSILRMSPDFVKSEFGLLDSLPAIFSKSDSSLTVSAQMISQRKSFQVAREEKEDLDEHDLAIRDQISNVMAIYDADEVEVQGLKAKMAAWLDKAEMLERELLSNRNRSLLIGQQLLNLKDDFQMWTKTLQEAEATQLDCLAKWEQLRALFQ